MVLAELASRVALFFEEIGDRRTPVGYAMLGPGHADRQQAGAKRMLAQNKCGPPRCAGLLSVGIGKQRTLLRDPIDVGGAIPHDAVAIGTDIVDAYVVTPNDEDVRFVRGSQSHVLKQDA